MIKTLNPYSAATTAKTAEIMSRYRPIAPKPEPSPSSSSPPPPPTATANAMNEVEQSSLAMSQKMMQSPYLRNLWPQLQANPTRTRKRGRNIALSLPPTLFKRARTTHDFGLSSPSPAKNPCFSHGRIPLCSVPNFVKEKGIDLNVTEAEILEEKDLLRQLLQGPPPVIAPQPIRPVASSITVVYINDNPITMPQLFPKKLAEEVEAELESEALPAVISDSKNRVRLANSAYKEMVGQPECVWLDSMVGPPCKRICGEVMLHLSDDLMVPLKSSKGFSCWVRIEWGSDDEGKKMKKKRSINAFCDVVRLSCDESKDYLFTWRFHTYPEQREASKSSFNV